MCLLNFVPNRATDSVPFSDNPVTYAVDSESGKTGGRVPLLLIFENLVTQCYFRYKEASALG